VDHAGLLERSLLGSLERSCLESLLVLRTASHIGPLIADAGRGDSAFTFGKNDV
jgi:hypothetical protein